MITNKLNLGDYHVYLCEIVFGDLDDLINTKILTFEEYIIGYGSK